MSIMQKKFHLIFLFFVILFSANLHALETVQGNLPLKIEGEKVDYLLEKGFVIAVDKASILYKDIKIFADRLEIDVNKEEVKAIDNVYYVKDKNTIRAKYLFYDLKNQKGYFTDVTEGSFPPWYWKGERIEILSEDEFILSRGSFTTCDKKFPHYHLSCSSATINLDDKAAAKNVFFYVGGFPIFYFPYYYTYMNRPPYGLVNWLGGSDEKGWMDLAHYNWYVNPNFRGRVYLDYIQNLGWGEGFDIDLKTEHGKNYIYGYYMDENEDFYDRENITRYGGTAEGNEKYKRWKGIFKHRQEWEGDLTSIIKIEKFSDENFNKDFYFEEMNKGVDSFALSRAPENYFSLEQVKPNYNSILYVNGALNDFEQLIERKPSVSFSTREQKIEGLPFNYKIDANYSDLEEVFPEDENVEGDTEVQRWDILGRISSPHKISDWLVSEPYLTLEGTGYSESLEGDEVFRSTESVGWNFRTKLVKPYGDVQHIFQPQIGYYYRPEPSIPRDNLIRLDPIDRITSQNGFFVEFVNRLKVPQQGGAEEYLPSQEYDDFYHRENEAQKEILASTIRSYEKTYREPFNLRILSNYSLEEHKWDYVFVENTIIPITGLSLISDATYTPEIDQFQIINSTLGLSKWEKVGGSLGVSYYKDENLCQGNGSIWFNFPSNMAIQLVTTYDFNNDFVRSNGVYVNKSLHCWTAELQWNRYKNTRDEQYTSEIFFTLSITEAPGFKIPFSKNLTPAANGR